MLLQLISLRCVFTPVNITDVSAQHSPNYFVWMNFLVDQQPTRFIQPCGGEDDEEGVLNRGKWGSKVFNLKKRFKNKNKKNKNLKKGEDVKKDLQKEVFDFGFDHQNIKIFQ